MVYLMTLEDISNNGLEKAWHDVDSLTEGTPALFA